MHRMYAKTVKKTKVAHLRAKIIQIEKVTPKMSYVNLSSHIPADGILDESGVSTT